MFKLRKHDQSSEKPAEPVLGKGETNGVEPQPQLGQNPEPMKLGLDKPSVKEAIAQGKAILKEGKSKADAARAMYALLKDEDKDLIVAAFVHGATLTQKGALTYWYNCKRKAKKDATAGA